MSTPGVLLITGEYPPMPGGISDYTSLLTSELQDLGVRAIILSSDESAAGETVPEWTWRTNSTVREIINRHNIDVVHVQYQAGAFGMHPVINLLPWLLRDVPVVTTFHDLRPPYLFPKAGRLRFLTMRRMARWSAMTVVTNPSDERTLRSANIPTMLIPLGPSLPLPDVALEPDPSIGYFGFPSRQKGFDLLVAAIGRFPAGARPSLCIIGERPPRTGSHGFMSVGAVEELAGEHRVTVNWTGFLNPQAASNALARCAIIAFPFPNGATQRSSALIATLQTGRPVLTTTAGDTGALTGLAQLPQLITVPTGVPAHLQQALAAAMTSPVNWRPLPPEYAWRSIAARHADLYQTLLREARQ